MPQGARRVVTACLNFLLVYAKRFLPCTATTERHNFPRLHQISVIASDLRWTISISNPGKLAVARVVPLLVRWSVKHFSIWNVGVNNSPAPTAYLAVGRCWRDRWFYFRGDLVRRRPQALACRASSSVHRGTVSATTVALLGHASNRPIMNGWIA
jgi:hypothetical protein